MARLLAAERTGETQLLRARGASRATLAGLAAREALLLAGPALLIAPLLAGPLVRLLAGQGRWPGSDWSWRCRPADGSGCG